MRLEFTDPKILLKEVTEVLERLDGTEPPAANGSAPGSGQTARELLATADALTYAAALVRNEYHRWKGGISL